MKALTKGEIREKALQYFTAIGFDCWKNNNIAVRGRAFIGRYGVSDVIGYEKSTGLILMAEVKAKGDRLSYEQAEMLVNVNKAGGYGFLLEYDGDGGVAYRLYLVNDVKQPKK